MSKPSYANTVTNNTNQGDNSANVEEIANYDTEETSMTSNLHPLYLQNIDHPGLILITKKLSGSENFGP